MQGLASSPGVGGFLPDGPDLAFWRCGRVNGLCYILQKDFKFAKPFDNSSYVLRVLRLDLLTSVTDQIDDFVEFLFVGNEGLDSVYERRLTT